MISRPIAVCWCVTTFSPPRNASRSPACPLMPRNSIRSNKRLPPQKLQACQSERRSSVGIATCKLRPPTAGGVATNPPLPPVGFISISGINVTLLCESLLSSNNIMDLRNKNCSLNVTLLCDSILRVNNIKDWLGIELPP